MLVAILAAVLLIACANIENLLLARRTRQGIAALPPPDGARTLEVRVRLPVLLGSAGLFLKSLVSLRRVDLGIRIDSVARFSVAPMRALRYD